MNRALGVVLVILGLCWALYPAVAAAESVRIAPLEYKTTLQQGEKKKGSVDITNPTNETVKLRLYVQSFSQVDTKGNLTFFQDEQLEKGLLLDYDSITLEPHQTMRVFFIADGTKLPSGDVFGVIFAETVTEARPGTNIAARVGTLVMLTNGTPGPRTAEISELAIPFVQLGETFSGAVTVKNTAEKGKATGFFPKMSVQMLPWGSVSEFEGPLIFANNTRTMTFESPSNHFGFYTVTVRANDAEKSTTVFLITGWWRVIVPAIVVFVGGCGALIVKYRLWRRLSFIRRAR